MFASSLGVENLSILELFSKLQLFVYIALTKEFTIFSVISYSLISTGVYTGHKCTLVDGEIHDKQVATLYIVPLASHDCLFKLELSNMANNNICYTGQQMQSFVFKAPVLTRKAIKTYILSTNIKLTSQVSKL